MGIITVNSNLKKLFGYIKLNLVGFNSDFDNVDALETCLNNYEVSEKESEYIITLIKSALNSNVTDDIWLIVSNEAAMALGYAIAELETDGYIPPFTMEEDSTFNNIYSKNYEWTMNLDGSGNYSDSLLFALLGGIFGYASEIMCYPEIIVPLYEGLVSKQDNSDNVAITFNIPDKVWSKRIYNAVNSALVDLDSEGEDISGFFADGMFDDEYFEEEE